MQSFTKIIGKKRILFLFFYFVFLSCIVRFPAFLFDFFSNDEGAHITGSLIIDSGKTLYKDFVDNKGPVIYLLYWFSWKLLKNGMFSVHLVTTVFLIPFIAFLLAIMHRNIQARQIATGTLFIIFISTYIPTDMLATNCELAMLPFAALSFYSLINLDFRLISYFISGIFMGITLLGKLTAGVWLLVPIIVLAKHFFSSKISLNQTLLSIVLFFSGVTIPIFVVAGIFYKLNALNEFIYFNIIHNIKYSQNPLSLYGKISRCGYYLAPFIVIISPLLHFYFSSRKNLNTDIRIFFESALVLSLLPVFLGFRFFPHYFIQGIFPLSFLAGTYFGENKPASLTLKLFAVYCAILVTIVNTYTLITYSKETKNIEETTPAFRKIPQYLSQSQFCSASEGGKVFVWGYAPIFYYYFHKYCGFLPASRFVIPQASLTGYVPGNQESYEDSFDGKNLIIQSHRKLLIQDLINNKPDIIVDTSPSGFHHWEKYPLSSFPQLHEFISRNYILLITIDKFAIYKKKYH